MFRRELALRPNCLLTRRPIWILTKSPVSRLFPSNYPWSGLQDFLSQHGYVVSFRSFKSLARSCNEVGHIVCEPDLFSKIDPQITQSSHLTFTLVSKTEIPALPQNIFQVSILAQPAHAFYSKMLDHCIVLAELDYLKG